MDSSLHQAPPSMGFSRQEYWRGLPFPSPGNLPNPGIKPRDQTQVSHIVDRCFNHTGQPLPKVLQCFLLAFPSVYIASCFCFSAAELNLFSFCRYPEQSPPYLSNSVQLTFNLTLVLINISCVRKKSSYNMTNHLFIMPMLA